MVGAHFHFGAFPLESFELEGVPELLWPQSLQKHQVAAGGTGSSIRQST